MRAGKLRHRVLLQRPVKTQDAQTGAVVKSWADIGWLWAEVYPVSAREFAAAQAEQREITVRVTVRWRADISTSDRLLFRGKIYNIQGVLPDPNSGREYLTLPCSEGVNSG